MMYRIIIIICFFLTAEALSQTTGYMGKRLYITYYNVFGPSIYHIRNSDPSDYQINTSHFFDLTYVTGRRTEIGATLQLYNFSMSSDLAFYYEVKDNYNNYYTGYYCTPQGEFKAHGISYGVHIKSYLSEWLAPLGSYFQYELLFLDYGVSDIEKLTYPESEYEPPTLRADSRYKTAAINITMGRHKIFFDCLMIDYGLRMGWVFGGYKVGTIYNELTRYNYLDIATKRRLMINNLINFKVGVGFLIK